MPFKAPAGAVVVQNHENGHIVALASYPTFDNRWFESDLGDGRFEELFPSKNPDGTPIDPDESILVNRAIQGRYNLGSTFKPFTAYAALNTGLLGTGDVYVDRGTYRMDSIEENRCNSGLVRCVFKNATCSGTGRPCVYGAVDVELALAVSSDAFFYRIGEQIMVENDYEPVLQEQVELFGFGADTGIDLPFEFDGTVPDKELKARYAELGVISEDEGSGYFTGDNVQLAIGQGLLSASPLQLANGYATIANGGFVLRPEIIKAIYEPGVPDSAQAGYADLSQARFAEEPNRRGDLVRQVPLSEEIGGEITRGLRRVITGPGHDERLLPLDHRGEAVLQLSLASDPRRRQDRNRPGRRQLPVERLVGVRRVQHRPGAPVHRVGLPREERVRLTGRRSGREVHLLAAVGNRACRPGRTVRSARHERPGSGPAEASRGSIVLCRSFLGDARYRMIRRT